MVAGIAGLALALAGCSGGDADEGSGSDSRDAKVQLYQAPNSFNPLIASIGPNHLMDQLHWDSLVTSDADNQYAPRLAENWEVSDDGSTWTFHLLEGVTWSDGEPFTSADVKFSYELYANPASGSAYAGNFAGVVGAAEFAAGTADAIEGFQTPDDQTFVVELTTPNVGFLEVLVTPTMFVLPQHVVGEFPVEGLVDNPFFREPTVGIGPYVFEQWVTDDQVEFHANPEYRTDLGLDRVFAQYLPTDVAMAQLETGEIDFAQVAAPDAERAEGIDGVTLHRTDGPGVLALHTAMDSGKLADPRVRQAIMYAVDREALVNEVLAGEGKVVDTLVHGPDWAVPDGLTHYDYNPEKARDLLAQAGWDPATKVRIEIVPGQRDRDTTVTIVAAQLQEVGIDAEVTQMEPAQQAEAIANRDFDLLISGYGNFVIDPSSMNLRLLCSQAAPAGPNLSAYCNQDLDALLEAGIATTDQTEREQIYAQAQQIVNAEVPIVVLYVPNTLAATNDRLTGFELNAQATHAFGNADEWSLSE